jgi:hypothetical protein
MLVRAGKVNYVGVSNFSGWHLMKSLRIAGQNGWPRYAAHQVYYSLVGRDYEWELMPLGLRRAKGGGPIGRVVTRISDSCGWPAFHGPQISLLFQYYAGP